MAVFTVEEGVPGVWLQHICSVVRGAAAPLQTLRLSVLWETAVTGQGLWDVIHSVHLQAGLVFKNSPQRCNVRKRRVEGSCSYVGTITHVEV